MFGWAGFVLGAVLLAGCGGTNDASSPTPVASGSIGPAGGTVASADGRIALAIPAGALGAVTEIRIVELSGDAIPAGFRPAAPDKVYRLEPSGTTFAAPVRVTLVLPPSPIGAIALLLHESGGEFEVPVNASLSMTDTERTLSGDISHFSHIFADTAEAVTIKMTLDAAERPVGGVVTATVVVATTAVRIASFPKTRAPRLMPRSRSNRATTSSFLPASAPTGQPPARAGRTPCGARASVWGSSRIGSTSTTLPSSS
jgi:hypothetical protein